MTTDRLSSLAKHFGLILIGFVMLYPVLWMVVSSLRPGDEIFRSPGLILDSLHAENYTEGWYALSPSFGTYLLNSATLVLGCIVGNLVSCSMAAYAFARLKFPLKNFWFALMLGTLMLPYHVTLIPQYVLFLHLDWVNTFLPLVVPKFLAADAFFIFLLTQFFRTIPRELDEAAMIDGCGPWGIYWKIILPLSLPALATAAIFTFIWTWDDFFGPLVYLTDMANYTVQLGLRSFVDSTGKSDWGALFAMSVLTLLPVFAFFLFFQRLLIEGIATTGTAPTIVSSRALAIIRAISHLGAPSWRASQIR